MQPRKVDHVDVLYAVVLGAILFGIAYTAWGVTDALCVGAGLLVALFAVLSAARIG